VVTVCAGAVLVVGGLVWDASAAVFTASTANPGNSWVTGSVSVTDDQGGSAVLRLAGVVPDAATEVLAPPATGAWAGSGAASGGSACIKVTYSGSEPADVRLYATLENAGADGGLGPFLLFDVDTGAGPSAGTDVACAGYTSHSYLFGSAANPDLRLGDLPASYDAGLAWDGAGSGDTRWYRLSWLMPRSTGNEAQDERVEATFVWEARTPGS
jgi:hypothetical protein